MPYRPIQHWGNSLWKYIHDICIVDNSIPEENVRQNSYALECLKKIADVIPCHHCRQKWNDNLLELDALDLTKSMVLFEWAWKMHNKVNDKLHKPIISYEDALEIYTKII